MKLSRARYLLPLFAAAAAMAVVMFVPACSSECTTRFDCNNSQESECIDGKCQPAPPVEDAGTPPEDAGMEMDAGMDAGMVPDAGMDAGMMMDGGMDAGMQMDAGMDAGTLCDVPATAFTAKLAGSQEVPPVASARTGSATFVLTGTSLAWNVTHTVTNPTAGHIHSGHAGQSGDVVVPICSSQTTCTGTITGSATLTAAQLTALQNGNLYVNIHSTMFPNGEIRGQILKTGEKLYSSELTDGGTNSAGFIVDQADTCLHYNVTLTGQTGVTGASITNGTTTLLTLSDVTDTGGEATVPVTASTVTTLDMDAGVLDITGTTLSAPIRKLQ